MENREPFSTMDAEQMKQVNGGGFAYDVGRTIRFICLARNPFTLPMAITEWIINDTINQVEKN